MDPFTSSSSTTTSLHDKIILLGFLALTTVEVVQGRVFVPHHHQQQYFGPHELPDVGDMHGTEKLQRYRHRRWGGSNNNNNLNASPTKTAKHQSSTTSSPDDNNILQDQLLVMLHQQIRGGAAASVDGSRDDDDALLQWDRQLDCSDSPEQVRVLKHHYLNEFGQHISLAEVLKDYSEKCTIHQVVDNVPKTFHGKDGARQAFRNVFNLVPHDLTHSIEFEHIAIDHNHAQVVWKAEVPSRNQSIRGMDSFAFDKDDRIVHQSVMALSVPTDNSQEGRQYDSEESGELFVEKF